MLGYVSRRIRHDCNVSDSSEDVDIEPMRLPRLGTDGVVQSRTACVGVRDGKREQVAVAVAVAALLA